MPFNNCEHFLLNFILFQMTQVAEGNINIFFDGLIALEIYWIDGAR